MAVEEVVVEEAVVEVEVEHGRRGLSIKDD